MTDFKRQVETEIARRRPCSTCGGTYRENLHRVFHEQSCPRWKSKPILQTPAQQDAEREELTMRYDPDGCAHGMDTLWECPRCSEEADRAAKERPLDVDP